MLKKSLYSYSLNELKQIVENYNHKSFRAKQINDDLYKCRYLRVNEFNSLPSELKEKLEENHEIFDFQLIRKLTSSDEKTSKFLFLTKDQKYVETVLMKYDYGNTVCVSSQIGCRMGCNFCASTVNGLDRNLDSYEILQQIAYIQYAEKLRVSNIVIMGMGEPLDNYNEVIKFIRHVASRETFNISMRKITLSTCGIVPKIMELADEDMPINLALSLHNPFNHKRREIMPIATAYSVQQIMKAIDYYIEKTGRRVSIEYTLIESGNDGIAEAKEICKLIKGKLIHVNLIPLNELKDNQNKASKKHMINKFKNYLLNSGINVTVRKSLGQNIEAACGQLRAENLTKIEI